MSVPKVKESAEETTRICECYHPKYFPVKSVQFLNEDHLGYITKIELNYRFIRRIVC